jgi:hypothetical protein
VWGDFESEAQAYWNALDDSEKEEVISVNPAYWEGIQEHLDELVPTVSRESHLSTPFSLLYASPHNKAIHGAIDDHARLTTQIPDNVVGQPDACFEKDNKLVGIVEIKSFWNVTEASINEVLHSTVFLWHFTDCFRYGAAFW